LGARPALVSSLPFACKQHCSLALNSLHKASIHPFLLKGRGGGAQVGFESRWAWAGSRFSCFITCVTLASPGRSEPLPYLLRGREIPTWRGCCGAQMR
jgi:hypothetical protein